MAEQDISFTDNAFAHNTGKNDRLCEPSKTSFFRFDKNYRPRECNKTKKVLLLSQTANISAVTNETLYLCDICKKKKKKITIWTKTSSKELHSTNSHDIVDITSPMEDTSVENSQQKITSRFERGTYKEPQFVKIFNTVYDKVVFWRKNIFLLSSGKSGK